MADATALPLEDKSVDLVFGSPPYCDARTYGINGQRDCEEWVDWMLLVTKEALRVCKGPVLWVASGVTRQRNYWPACEGLMWEWRKRGGQLYRPFAWTKVGIPGSGHDDWFRADWEFVMCFKRPGKLPWSRPKLVGHPPKWAPGGEMSHRTPTGRRVNRWGHSYDSVSCAARNVHGKRHTKRKSEGSMEEQTYKPPAIANPGNVLRIPVGGGLIGDRLAHETEAPFPEKLAEFFIKALCRPSGIVLDPFSGSGTTAKVAQVLGRKWIASDIRKNQCELTKKRIRACLE